MRVLQLSSLYPPKALGGAEVSARNLSELLASAGHEVMVVRTADLGETPGTEQVAPRIRVARLATPHTYPVFRFYDAPAFRKPLWHLQDHFHPGARKAFGRMLDEFKPDLVNVHLVQGLGYPLLKEVAKRQVPVNYVLPDLGLACIRMSMFKNGKDCPRQCAGCRLSSRYKLGIIRAQSRVSFVSPSRANLETLARYFPVSDFPSAVILNPNSYPKPTAMRTESPTLRLLYAGRIHESKGLELLLEAISILARGEEISIAIAGKGQQEEALRARFGAEPWCTFLGFVTHAELADLMVQSDLLCIPSIWAENSPGVVIQSLGLGLPVMGSARGGIPELIRPGENGALVEESTPEAWRDAIAAVLDDQTHLQFWRKNAIAKAMQFDPDVIGRSLLDWMEASARGKAKHRAVDQ